MTPAFFVLSLLNKLYLSVHINLNKVTIMEKRATNQREFTVTLPTNPYDRFRIRTDVVYDVHG